MSRNDKIPSGTSPISGSSLWNIFRLVKGNKIDRPYIVKFILSYLVAIILEPFRWIEHLIYDKKVRNFNIEEDPVFIVGHWRSGTTFLHNVLCQDPTAAYITTYQTIYPEMLFSGRRLIKATMQAVMPKKRPFDNMELGADLPQEGEFALTNTNAMGQTNSWHFPRRWREYYKKYVEFSGMDDKVLNRWKAGYTRVIKKALINTGGVRFISKNPPNTGRIKVLLEMFPNARFIHIYRHPVTTYVSTTHLVKTLIPVLTFQNISDKELDENTLWQYRKMMQQYECDKSQIPPGNLIEIRYEDFEKDPVANAERIYNQLRIPDFDKVKPLIENYLATKQSYKKNEYVVSVEDVKKVAEHWDFAMKQWSYEMPELNHVNTHPATQD